jgi:hypothetical protein
MARMLLLARWPLQLAILSGLLTCLAAQEPDQEAEPGSAAAAPAAPEETAAPGGEGEPAAAEELPHFEPIRSRWYEDPWALVPPPPYEINRPGRPLDPYRQNQLKGDFPIMGDDIFLSLTGTERLILELRGVPTRTGITGPAPDRERFFGEDEQFSLSSFSILTVDLFKGQQAFKPVDWRLRVSGVFNVNYLDVEEVGVVRVDVSEGRERTDTWFALQEALAEIHLATLSRRFDFLSVEFGILPFRSDFRGFLFDDTNLGVRLFGNLDNNRWQYNLAAFRLLEKDTNSELNTFDDRDQLVLIGNLYRQDFIVPGYTAQISVHYNHDEGDEHFNENGFLVRPAPVGFARTSEIDACYLGWTGEGHIGRLNLTHAFYQALGEQTQNPFAARDVDINAQFAALELSLDFDWFRVRGFGQVASGDDDTRDDDAEGFDSILDVPAFAGGELSLWNRQAVGLLGVNLTQRHSPLPDLTTSPTEGQANFVNPGLLQIGGAVDVEITPRLRGQAGASYLRFAETDPLQIYLQLEDIDEEIGTEWFVGAQYRPLLTNNIILNLGLSALHTGEGFKKMYPSSDETLLSLFGDLTFTW